MATTTQLAIETYLKTSYHPDCDFVDGEIEERNLGEFDHAALQAALVAYFYPKRQGWNIHVLPEQRVRVSATRVRIPDVCLVSRDLPIEQVITRPPLVVVEILSPEDRLSAIFAKCERYHDWGVPFCWIVDPIKEAGWEYHKDADPVHIDQTGTLTAGTLKIDLSDLFR